MRVIFSSLIVASTILLAGCGDSDFLRPKEYSCAHLKQRDAELSQLPPYSVSSQMLRDYDVERVKIRNALMIPAPQICF